MMALPYSIITVCLNAKSDIEKTLQSLEKQECKEFEWIVIDGKSTDGTLDLLTAHPLVSHCLSEPDRGIYEAMNKGLRLAQGRYLLFLNAGDALYSSSTLQEVQKYLEGDLVIGKIFTYGAAQENKNRIRNYADYHIGKDYMYNCTLPHQATFIKKELFQQYGGYCEDFTISGDHDFFARLLVQGVSFSFMPLCVASFPMNGVSQQMKQSKLLQKELALVRKRNFPLTYRIRARILSLLSAQ
jgi:glycosyltransferase involved in cell wall biosynthesis